MGNREDLLGGAKRCLYDKGYSRTTARDIAAAAGVSLAAIGYHYGTKEALLNEALVEAMQEWGDDLGRVLAEPADFETTWGKVIDSFARARPLWAIQFELIAHMERTPELRESFVEAGRQARLGLAELFGSDSERMGAVVQTLLGGLAAQWLVDPDGTPTPAELLEGLRALVGSTRGASS
ncbi:TetR/AcrR family transcriptional regulator [Streptosporangium canum]|uniref:Transcriptional regulator, TetR family n=1 Tax=Streptosporangium canum TaxID=324952 RepID=A0A1I3Y631_9ACTN|nr:TetR/AcrR family transcriptional regulator [Streptosporangium canum]SFK27324.1 transcriptional regulator, TetR family [Streptosporangium canum]